MSVLAFLPVTHNLCEEIRYIVFNMTSWTKSRDQISGQSVLAKYPHTLSLNKPMQFHQKERYYILLQTL